MKSLIKKSLTYIFILFCILGCLFFISGALTTNQRLGTTLIKQEGIAKIDSRKMILIGGSNLHYGINTKMLSDSLSLPVINMGIHASIGLGYMMNEIMDNVKKDDIIILLAEPSHYTSVDINGENALYNLISKYPKGLKYLNAKQYLNSIYHIGPTIKENFEYWCYLKLNKLKNRRTVFEDTNEWGDYIGHKDKPSTFNAHQHQKSPKEVSEDVIDFLNRSKSRIQSKGAFLYISFAPMATSAVSVETFQNIQNKLTQHFKESVLGDIHTYNLPDEFFYDTNHHLIYDKREMRTNMLIQDISSNKNLSKSIKLYSK